MSFDSGSFSFRVFYLQKEFDSELLERFSQRVAPSVESLQCDKISGWVSGRHLLDRELTEEKCLFGDHLYVQLMQAERKIPAPLLRAYTSIEEEVELRARNVETLPRAVKFEVHERVKELLQPEMPPTLTSIPLVVDFRNQRVFASAMSDKQIDAFCAAFRESAGSMPVLMTAESAAVRMKSVNAYDLPADSIVPLPSESEAAEPALGMDFMTWLWFVWDTTGGVFHLPDGGEYGFMLEGPLTFFHEGKGAHEAVLRKGMPLNSREAGVALECGKRLKRATLHLAIKSEEYTAVFDADFAIRSLKLPKGEQHDPYGRFMERMLNLDNFCAVWLDLYQRFLEIRVDQEQWLNTLQEMRTWIARVADNK